MITCRIKDRSFVAAIGLFSCVFCISAVALDSSAHAGNVSCGGNCSTSDDCTDASACYGGTCMTSGWSDPGGQSCNFTPDCNPSTPGAQCSCGYMTPPACQCDCSGTDSKKIGA